MLKPRKHLSDGQKKSADVSKAAVPTDKPLTAKQIEANGRIASIKSQLKLNTDEMQDRITQQTAIHSEIAGLHSRIENLPVREQEMAGLMRDYEIFKG